MKYLFSKKILILAIGLILASCNGYNFKAKFADSQAEKNNFVKKLVKGGDFWLVTYQKITDPLLPFVFYIEGDGKAFLNKYTLSDNPTPSNPILYLAILDSRPNVVYMARPCQFFSTTQMQTLNPYCNAHYWTNKRMSQEVITSMNDAIKTISGGRNAIDLIGYSGGGGIAVLIAANNSNVKSIVTINGNLNHNMFNKKHNTPPLIDSLNPINYATKIRNIPQLHLSGGRDTAVPPFIVESFVKASNSYCVHQEIIPDATHQKGWKKVWPYFLSRMPIKCY